MINSIDIVAVIPCYNEQVTIYAIVKESLKYVNRVVVINDGSQDQTEKEAAGAGAIVINHDCNKGKGVALETAFNYLRKNNCKAAVFLDGDGQHAPCEIPQIIKPILEDRVDMVIGSRFLREPYKIPKYRRIGQVILNLITNIGSQIKVTDTQSGFRGFSARAINAMRFMEKGFSVESEMQFIAGRIGLKVSEVPISTIYTNKARRSPLTHGFGVLIRVLHLTWKPKLYVPSRYISDE